MGGNISTQNRGAQRRDRRRGGHSRHHHRLEDVHGSSHAHHDSSRQACRSREPSAHSSSAHTSRPSSRHAHTTTSRHAGAPHARGHGGHEQLAISPTGPPASASDPTEGRSFAPEHGFQTLARWGYEVRESDGAGGGGARIVNLPRPGAGGAWQHLVARVHVSSSGGEDDENESGTMRVTDVDTENQPGRCRPHAANILLAFWAGTGRSVSALRAVQFHNVVEDGMFNEVVPHVYASLGEPEIRVGSVWIVGPEQGRLFDYVARESKLARIAAFMLRCRELRMIDMRIERFEFVPFAARGEYVACEQFRVIFASHS